MPINNAALLDLAQWGLECGYKLTDVQARNPEVVIREHSDSFKIIVKGAPVVEGNFRLVSKRDLLSRFLQESLWDKPLAMSLLREHGLDVAPLMEGGPGVVK